MTTNTANKVQSILLQAIGIVLLITIITAFSCQVIKYWDKLMPWYDWILPIMLIISAAFIIILGRKWNK